MSPKQLSETGWLTTVPPESVKIDHTVIRAGVWFGSEWVEGLVRWTIPINQPANWSAETLLRHDRNAALLAFTHWQSLSGPP